MGGDGRGQEGADEWQVWPYGCMAGWRSEELTDMWQENRKEEKETEDVASEREVHRRFGLD